MEVRGRAKVHTDPTDGTAAAGPAGERGSSIRLRRLLLRRRRWLSFGLTGGWLHRFQFLFCHIRLLRTGIPIDDSLEKVSGIRLVTQFQEGEALLQ